MGLFEDAKRAKEAAEAAQAAQDAKAQEDARDPEAAFVRDELGDAALKQAFETSKNGTIQKIFQRGPAGQQIKSRVAELRSQGFTVSVNDYTMPGGSTPTAIDISV